MPTKSSNMPMQPKIGDASLKFGPDWLRALSSSETTSPPNNNSGAGGGDGGGFPSPPSRWGPTSSMMNSNKEHHHHHHHYNNMSSMNFPGSPSSVSSSTQGKNRFKQPEFRYSREEMLALYDKNLEAPGYLVNCGGLYIEKMQPPLAFSQPSEDEIRIWQTAQPDVARGGMGGSGPSSAAMGGIGGGGMGPMGRGGYMGRGRGSALDRGRGRGRGGFYSATRPHNEDGEEGLGGRGSFSRPRNFERSQSNHERTSWSERNGVMGPAGAAPPDDLNRNSWRAREGGAAGGTGAPSATSFSGRRHDDNDDGWRKPRWRREDNNEDDYRSNRRINRSWSEDENNHDNLPEWARDNPSEESGTFDSTGAFHGDRSSRDLDGDKKNVGDNNEIGITKGSNSEHSSGSHSDNRGDVQKRLSDRERNIPEEELEPAAPHRHPSSSSNSSSHFDRSTNISSSIKQQQDETNNSEIMHRQIGIDSVHQLLGYKQQHQQMVQNVQHQMTAPNSQQSGRHRTVSDKTTNNNEEEAQLRSMTEEALNLVSKLIEVEDPAPASNNSHVNSMLSGIHSGGMSQQQQKQKILASLASDLNLNDLNANTNSARQSSVTASSSTVPAPAVSPAAKERETWYYRDPQGNVQGPFSSGEMGLWCEQGYFSSSLQLRRECDKVFVTLMEMGKRYGRNPFAEGGSLIPPPIEESISALPDYPINVPRPGDNASQLQAQLRQQQMLQQTLLRERQQQQQYMMNLAGGPKEGWQSGIPGSPGSVIPQQTRSVPNTANLTAEQIQATILMSQMNMAKSQGDVSSQMDQIHTLINQQQRQPQNHQKNNYSPEMIPPANQSTPNPDPIQSLVQQLAQMKMNAGSGGSNKPATTSSSVPDPWGQVQAQAQAQTQVQAGGQWGTTQPPQTPWEYREQMAKLQQEEEIRRRKHREEEEERKQQAAEEEERKRKEAEEQDRKLREEQQQRQLEEEKQRMLREEQLYRQQQQQAEFLRKQQIEAEAAAELQRQKEIQRQQLEQQRQLRDEQTRLAEEQQQRREKEQAELKLRQEQQLKQQQQQFSWSQPPAPVAAQGKSLLEIQQEEAKKQEVEKKQQQEQQLRLQQQQQQQQQKAAAINLKWAQSAAPPGKAAIKSLTEIQAEEQAKLQKQQEHEREKRAVLTHQNQQQAAWNAQLTWANRASTGPGSGSGSKSTGTNSKKVNGGIWDDSSASPTLASKIKGTSNNVSSSNNSTRPQPSSAPQPGRTPTSKGSKDNEDSFMKLFNVQDEKGNANSSPNKTSGKQASSPQNTPAQDEFTRWCFDRVSTIARDSVDIPTFVAFLKEVESPFEVGDYVRSYLGDGKDARDFSREFLERRSRWKNAKKEGSEDNLCRPASAVNPNSNEFQEVKGKGKKTKKGKMQKVDSRILGFSTSAAADRYNRGDPGDSSDY